MISVTRWRDFEFGSGIVNRRHTRFIVNIPKNASSFMHDWGKQQGWNAVSLGEATREWPLQEVVVIMRDPVERWISGFAQYASSWILNATRFFDSDQGPSPEDRRQSAEEFIESYSWLAERLIFDNLEVLDDHVSPQCSYFESLLPHLPRQYFYVDKEFESKIGAYLGFNPPTPDLDRNNSNNDPDKKILKQFFQNRTLARPELIKIIKQAYARDYEIIAGIKQ
jgi:hypothetical protein